MNIRRPLLAVAMVGITMCDASAQFGGMPGLPGATDAPPGPPLHCQQLLSYQKEAQRRAQAIEDANRKKARVMVACQLFQDYIAIEARMIRALKTHGQHCSVPPQINAQIEESHARIRKIATEVCDAAGCALDVGVCFQKKTNIQFDLVPATIGDADAASGPETQR